MNGWKTVYVVFYVVQNTNQIWAQCDTLEGAKMLQEEGERTGLTLFIKTKTVCTY